MWFLCSARENSGEHWFSRPSELALPRRDQQRLAQVLLLDLSLRRGVLLLSEE